jgi:hypothetical protein
MPGRRGGEGRLAGGIKAVGRFAPEAWCCPRGSGRARPKVDRPDVLPGRLQDALRGHAPGAERGSPRAVGAEQEEYLRVRGVQGVARRQRHRE